MLFLSVHQSDYGIERQGATVDQRCRDGVVGIPRLRQGFREDLQSFAGRLPTNGSTADLFPGT